MMRWLVVLAPCVLWLDVALGQPSRSQLLGPSLDQIAQGNADSDRNWHAFWQNHLGKWRGRWSRYSPSGELEDTFLSERQFRANPTRTEVVQVNRYQHSDGRATEKKWTYSQEKHSQKDGLTHPAYAAMRGLAFNDGAAALLIPNLQANQFAPFELFLKRGNIRHSVALLYGKSGELLRTSSIREVLGSQSAGLWTDTVVQMKPWNPPGNWQGTKREIQPDLSSIPIQPTNWQWKTTEQFTVYLPDQIIVRCPKQLSTGQPFSIRVLWLVDNDALQTISADYDSQTRLISVTHQLLHPDIAGKRNTENQGR